MTRLHVGGSAAGRSVDLGHDELAALDARHQVPDVGAVVEGRSGAAVRLAGIAELVAPGASARFVHVESEDGGFTANLTLEQALGGGLVLYAHEGEPLPARFGGPFRLIFPDTEDCSVNVKFLGRIEFLPDPGSHTARCADDG